jgi:predicted phosphohydrolase
MSIWAIADIHASRLDPATGRPSKPMDIFGDHWAAHMDALEDAWREMVQPEDTVIVAGDIDWALHLNEARETLERLDSWKGRKILLRGNHDYWWSSKTTNKVRGILPPTMTLLHNNAISVEGFNVCGAKGSPVPGGIDWTAENAKLLNREEQRLQLSLNARDVERPTIAALHYPPFYRGHEQSPYRTILERHGVRACVYGHLHANAAAAGPNGRYGSIEYYLVAADALRFRPVLVAAGEEIIPPPPLQLPPTTREGDGTGGEIP